ncbi:hypothetical protein [Saccharicrinis fermentans]|uniref:Uncharacterized protein n=1 Tax=Saccharicrinis fermentans DSM 9555 = JCM 21142 TaxID=869213 RepID=W7Y746_9BACT|nr:hypothetical protein [Saccharicrinis fermentans]GAF03503.1 hypothetical protein JCM21142_52180 [Saccharicrinis fermentans DSM 9555 = JCM 21142]
MSDQKMQLYMLAPRLIDDIRVHIFNASKITVGTEWNYSNIVSPFSRIYLIEDGECNHT